MSDIIFEILKIVVMLASLLVTAYVVPWLRDRINTDRVVEVEKWVKYAVLMAQQVYSQESGEKRKEIVLEIIYDILRRNNIDFLSDAQIDTLIEAAVKEMKIAGGKPA